MESSNRMFSHGGGGLSFLTLSFLRPRSLLGLGVLENKFKSSTIQKPFSHLVTFIKTQTIILLDTKYHPG